MILGRINKGEKTIRFNTDIMCVNCRTHVPGGMKTAEKYYGTDSFFRELDDFKKDFLCGKCRDKKRIGKLDEG